MKPTSFSSGWCFAASFAVTCTNCFSYQPGFSAEGFFQQQRTLLSTWMEAGFSHPLGVDREFFFDLVHSEE